ncbi:MAG: sugar phosphate nucleotidyltransferase [Planctomycetota bacterium]
MKIRTAVLTAAGPGQRGLPLEPLIDREGRKTCVLAAQLDEVFSAGLETAVLVVEPGAQPEYSAVLGRRAERVRFVEQSEPLGYAHALSLGLEACGDEPCLHLVGDHLFVADVLGGCARAIVEIAEQEGTTVCAVRSTREHSISEFGVVGGDPVAGRPGLFEVRRVIEKPTPTLAERELLVPGLRAGHYLGFFGVHALERSTVRALREAVAVGASASSGLGLSKVLDDAAGSERILAFEPPGRRFDLSDRYGLFAAQLAIGLEGVDREILLETVSRVLLERERRRAAEEQR